MQDTLTTVHTWAGYVVFAIVLIAGGIGLSRSKSGREFEAGVFSFAMILLDLQVTLGIVLYVVARGWDLGSTFAYVHPAIMLLALAIGHAGLGRARREQMVDAAHRVAGRSLLIAAVVIAVGIGVASAA